MPSYPDSVKSFTAKTAGQNIDPAHINDLQDEVNAIEAGLRNATAPLNSSNSTVSRLSVTNGSTFGVRPVMPPPETARVYLASSVALGSGSSRSTMAWGTQDYITNSSMHSTATNPDRFSPQSTGIYQLRLQVTFNGAATTGFLESVILDSSVSLARCSIPGTSTQTTMQVAVTKRFDVINNNAFFITQARNSTLSTCSLEPGNGSDGTWAEFRKL